jgi:hypothetical protein
LIPLRRSRKCTKNGDGRPGVYMWEGTTSKVIVADRPYGEFYDFGYNYWQAQLYLYLDNKML